MLGTVLCAFVGSHGPHQSKKTGVFVSSTVGHISGRLRTAVMLHDGLTKDPTRVGALPAHSLNDPQAAASVILPHVRSDIGYWSE